MSENAGSAKQANSKQSPENYTAAFMVQAAVQQVLNVPITLNGVKYPSKTKMDVSISYPEDSPNFIEASGLSAEEWQLKFNADIKAICQSFIDGDTESASLKEILSTADASSLCALKDVKNVRVMKAKRKNNNIDLVMVISETGDVLAKVNGAVVKVVAATPEDTNTPVIDEVVITKKNTQVKKTNVIKDAADLLVRRILTQFLQSNVDVVAVKQLVTTQASIDRLNMLRTGKKGKDLKATDATIAELNTKIANMDQNEIQKFEKTVSTIRVDTQQQLVTFRNEAYSEGLQSVRNKEALNNNHRR